MKQAKQILKVSREKFLSLTIKDVSQVYNGKRNCCRCGCGGDYISTSYAREARSPINDKLVERRLRMAKKLVENGANVEYYDFAVDVETGNDRSMTFYIDEVK